MDKIIKSFTAGLGHLSDLLSGELVKKKNSKIIFAEFNDEKKTLAKAEAHINELKRNLSILQIAIESFLDGAFDKVSILGTELKDKEAIKVQKNLIDTAIVSLSKTLNELDHEENMFILMIKKIERVILKIEPLVENKEDGTKNYFSDAVPYYKAYIVTYKEYEKNIKRNIKKLKEEINKVAEVMLENIDKKKKISDIPVNIKTEFRASFSLCFLDLNRLEFTFKEEYRKIKVFESMIKGHLK